MVLNASLLALPAKWRLKVRFLLARCSLLTSRNSLRWFLDPAIYVCWFQRERCQSMWFDFQGPNTRYAMSSLMWLASVRSLFKIGFVYSDQVSPQYQSTSYRHGIKKGIYSMNFSGNGKMICYGGNGGKCASLLKFVWFEGSKYLEYRSARLFFWWMKRNLNMVRMDYCFGDAHIRSNIILG